MTPYYDEDGITIYHGDCREVLPKLRGHLLLTDPPYGNGTKYDGYEDSEWNLIELARDAFDPMLRAAPLVVITPGVANIHKWPEPNWTLCWFEAAGNGSGPWGFCTWQPVLVYGSDPYLQNGLGRRPDGFTAGLGAKPTEDKQETQHPVPKPLSVARWLVNRLTIEPSVVIDPFAGSGSFLRAARDLGHRAIGIEQSEKYCEIAVQRLAQGVLEFGE